jgi:predicted LPLAT superfamily acyltransferase
MKWPLCGTIKGVWAWGLIVWMAGAGCKPRLPTTSTLIEAVEQGDMSDIRCHLKRGADVNRAGEKGWNPLLMAAYLGDVRQVRLLIDQGATIHATNTAGATPLMVALYNGHVKVVRYLLEQRSDVNARTQAGRTPLMIAVRRGDIRLVKCLLEHGADVKARARNGATVMEEVARLEKRTGYQRSDLTDCLVRFGAVDGRTYGEDCILENAAYETRLNQR